MTDSIPSDQHFAIGEVALWLDCDESGPEVTIIGPREFDDWECNDGREGADYGYDVRYGDGDIGFEPERFLSKKPTVSEDRQLTDWDECPWQPNQVTA